MPSTRKRGGGRQRTRRKKRSYVECRRQNARPRPNQTIAPLPAEGTAVPGRQNAEMTETYERPPRGAMVNMNVCSTELREENG